jgi:ATP-dependent Lon protease
MTKRSPPEDINSIIKRPSRIVQSFINLTSGLSSRLEDILYFKNLPKDSQDVIIDKLENLHTLTTSIKPKMIQLLESEIPLNFKYIALKKMMKMEEESSPKLQEWIDAFLSLPFNHCIPLPVLYSVNTTEDCKSYMDQCQKTLDKYTYGMKDAKNQFMQLIGKWIVNPNSMGTAIALKGPMGTGKTTLIKQGISKILNRPFAFITLGGTGDGTFLEGHSYTYEGSTYGKIVDILIQSRCNNPIIYFDELDKISQTEKGNELSGILTHLIDTTQNSQFHDKYFSEIDFDLSKCLFIFSYNDESLVNPILKDRMYTIDIPGYEKKEKIIIARDYLIPEMNKEFNIDELVWTDEILDYIIDKTETESGVRNFKRKLETIFSKINLLRISTPEKINFPFTVTKSLIDDFIEVKTVVHTYLNMYL